LNRCGTAFVLCISFCIFALGVFVLSPGAAAAAEIPARNVAAASTMRLRFTRLRLFMAISVLE